MLTTINLQAGTERVYLRDVPGLFADALHPELPEGTPRFLSYLQKEATSRELAWQWCGINNNFPVSLTEQDLRELNEGVWRNLPPLKLLSDTGEGPRKLSTPVPEPEWEKYAEAFAASPPNGWRLIVAWRNTVFEQWLMNYEAREEWKRMVEQQATTGQLTPRSAVSGIPTPQAAGRQFMDAFLTVHEFTEFARKFGVDVRVPRLYVRTPLAAPLLAQLKAVLPGESVTVQSAMGRFSGRGTAPARDWVESLEADVQRQAVGFFTVSEAAQMLADEHSELPVKDLVERITNAQVNGRRLVRGPNRLPLIEGRHVREYMDLVKVEDLNEWLAQSGVDYRLRITPNEPTDFVPLEKTLAPYFELPLDQIPDAFATLVKREYEQFQWETLSPGQRRDLAQQKDMEGDPKKEGMRTFYWEQAVRSQELSTQMEVVRSKATPTMTDYHLQQQTLRELEAELQRVEAEKWSGHADANEGDGGGDSEPEQAQAPTANAPAQEPGEDEDWKEKARTMARAFIKRQRERDLYPSQQNIADEIAREFRKQGVVGAGGKPLSGSYIKRHALLRISSAQGKQLSTGSARGK